MKIAVFGLGYVGSVTGACLARMGHTVLGVDISAAKVRVVNSGHSPVLEKGLDALVAQVVAEGKLRATLDSAEALHRADVSLVTVGTPSRRDGSVNLDHVASALEGIGRFLRGAKKFHVVAVRSTVPPGTTEKLVIPTLEKVSRKKAGRDFGVCFHPEFLREGSSIHDFFHPPKTVMGTSDLKTARRLTGLWKPVKAPVFVTSFKTAEILKYADNTFHALKVSFANEIGALCKTLDIDSREVMQIFVQDTKLNISPLYLRPGFAFGGPCLPKDVRAVGWFARENGLHLPLIENILSSNSCHLERAVDLVLSAKKRRIGVLGLVFKSDTDDLRESPACALVKRLIGARKQVKVYDPRVRLDRLLGANQTFIRKELPSLPGLMTASSEELTHASDVVVLAGNHPEFQAAIGRLKKGTVLIDLVGLNPNWEGAGVSCRGIAW
ncbi:MAG TPA: nucleotide sugar dehydrogenase [Terriglobia bacterium]|nr:nucleotide sugar dehydrogenase [Terriglobia bacterium]